MIGFSRRLRFRWLLIAQVALSACNRPPAAPPGGPVVNAPADAPSATDHQSGTGAPVAASSNPSVPNGNAPVPEIWKQFSGEKALLEVRKQVEFGARASGTPANQQTRAHIVETLQRHRWEVEPHEFSDETPRGPLKFTNIIARFSAVSGRPASRATQQAIVCSHYDTKRFSTITFVGANDGGSSTGALLELASVLALDPKLASKIELVFFDGEEAVAQFTETDGLYGSRAYTRKLREQNRLAQFKFAILWDMIGDADLTITLSPDSPQPLTQEILSAADALGLRAHFSYYDRPIWDDHVPLNQAKIPAVDFIDFNYPSWHTADDTLDKLAADSLQKVGAVTLYHLRKALGE